MINNNSPLVVTTAESVIVNGIYSSEGTIDKIAVWEKYGYLVRYEALKLQARLPACVELDDLIQAGSIGLLNAMEHYEPKKGIALSTYISQRLRWALIDELREQDWVPRRVRSNNREVSAAITRVEQTKGGAASEADIAAELGVSLSEYQRMLVDTNTSQLYSLDELQEGLADSIEPLSIQHEQLNPFHTLMVTNLSRRISDEIKKLPEREQILLNLYYQQDLNMKEVGILLGVTETRVSQLHSQAIKRLRSRLENDEQSIK